MSSETLTALVGLSGAVVGAGASVFSIWFTNRLRRSAAKFEKWHDKRIAAVEKVYAAFAAYLDFLRRSLYVPRDGVNMDPFFEFSRVLEAQLVYLDDELAARVLQYQGELLLFWNASIASLSKEGEAARNHIQYDLDTKIPAYLPMVRNDIRSVVDPFRRKARAKRLAKSRMPFIAEWIEILRRDGMAS